MGKLRLREINEFAPNATTHTINFQFQHWAFPEKQSPAKGVSRRLCWTSLSLTVLIGVNCSTSLKFLITGIITSSLQGAVEIIK